MIAQATQSNRADKRDPDMCFKTMDSIINSEHKSRPDATRRAAYTVPIEGKASSIMNPCG